ncbi:hypothetical protein ACOZ4N_13500 [Halorientalis pallida]|uniref:hypothetical protein n=1 Tax=Halorientalis pallida TaxID=2479928 RepID=UPI003C6EB3BE
MNRRAFVGALAVALPLTAGCAGDTDPDTDAPAADSPSEGRAPTDTTVRSPTAASDVAVTYRYGSGYTGWNEALSVAPDGRLTYTYDCGRLLTDTGETDRLEGRLTREQLARLERLVAAADPSSWARYYDCEGPCPTDVPVTRVTLTVDGTPHETGFDPTAEIPDPLDDLVAFLQAQADEFEQPCR